MTDNEFIERFNRYITNHGLVLVELSNIEQYSEKYNIAIDNNNFDEYLYSCYKKEKFAFYIRCKNMFGMFFPSIDTMINGNSDYWSIFYFFEKVFVHNFGFNVGNILDTLSFIKGNSKEEVVLKLQIMGY